MKLTPQQRMMVKDGLPAACIMTPAQRAKAWERNPPRPMEFVNTRVTRNEDAATQAFRAEQEELRKRKVQASLEKMKRRVAAKAIDHTRYRWDPRKGQFVLDPYMAAAAERERKDRIAKSGLILPTDRHMALAEAGRMKQTGSGPKLKPLVAVPGDWAYVKSDTARRLAELNGVWDDKYAKLTGGLLVMSVRNRLKGLVKRGGTVKWN